MPIEKTYVQVGSQNRGDPQATPSAKTHPASNFPITGIRTSLSTLHPAGSPSGAMRKPFSSSSVMSNISCCWRLRELRVVRRAYATVQGVDDDMSPTALDDNALSEVVDGTVVCGGRNDEQHISISDGGKSDNRGDGYSSVGWAGWDGKTDKLISDAKSRKESMLGGVNMALNWS